MPTYDYPGVYIEEQQAESPIQGVGTSTAAFIGAARKGTPNAPTIITSFKDFKDKFDDDPMEGFYLWYAVRGFFDNLGRRAWIVRASSGRNEQLVLLDSRSIGAQPTLIVTARELGDLTPDIQVTVTHTSLVNTSVFRPQTNFIAANQDRIQVANPADASNFRPGDRILITDGSASEIATVGALQGALLLLTSSLTNTYSSGTVRLADLQTGDQVIRLEATASGLAPGSVVEFIQGSTTSGPQIVKQVEAERISPTLVTYRVTLEKELGVGFSSDPGTGSIAVQSQEFSLAISRNGTSENLVDLSMDRRHPRYVGTILAQQPAQLVAIAEPLVSSNAPLSERRPAEVASQVLTDGAADEPQNLTLADYQAALDALRDVDDVNFIAIPDSTDASVQLALRTHCIQMADRFAIFDAPLGVPPIGPGSVLDRMALLKDDRGFGALYYPWIIVPHPVGGFVTVPTAGHVAGIYARAEKDRGVHKAPANYTLYSVLGVVTVVNNETQGPINLEGVNVLRVFPGQASPIVWGARTTSNQTAWQYVNIRRLFLFLEESIEEGIRWAVFEPNNLQLWQKLRRTITEFLTRVWRDGALFGATAEEAFYVRIDEVINPPDERALGRLYIEIGVRPTYPAEFIIVRIGIWPGGSETSEG